MTRNRTQTGFSLVELMVGLTIGLLLLVVLGNLLVNSSRARDELDKTLQQIENGRYAMKLITDELRLAGYYGMASSVGKVPSALPDPCASDIASLTTALPLAVQGYFHRQTSPISCISDNDFLPGTDILVVRRARTNTVQVANAQPDQVYLQTNGSSHVLDVGANSGAFTLNLSTGLAPLNPYSVRIYFVSRCDVPASGGSCTGADDDNGNPVPTLKRLDLTAAGWALVPLVAGVEQFHVEYGVDNDGDGAPDVYVNEPATTDEWANVMTVRVSVLARNTRPTVGHVDEKSYTLGAGDSAITVEARNDNFKRHVYTSVVRLTNVSGRREK